MTYPGRWLEFSAGLALSALGAIGLVVREAHLGRRLDIDPLEVELARLAHTAAPGDGRSSTARGGAGTRS